MKIIIATGGTAGHVFPAIYTAAELKRLGHEPVFVGVFTRTREHIEQQGYRIFEVPAIGFSFKTPSMFWNALQGMVRSISQSWGILQKEKPAAVLGFGAYGSFGVVLAARLRGIPTVIHEQNVRPGKANKLLSFFVQKIAVSFDESCLYFPASRTVVTGYPARPVLGEVNRVEYAENFGLRLGRFTILVIGGSQGSQQLNKVFFETISLLRERMDFQVIHACGEKDYPEYRIKYSSSEIPFFLTPFLHDMDKAYALADLVIGRAGAGTVSELAALGIPAILIPYPFAGGHQRENALVLVKRDAARMIEEKDLSAVGLCTEILSVQKKPLSRVEILDRVRGVYHPDAAQSLASETLALIK